MALGECVSVSSQRDSELAQLATDERELREDANQEFAELVAIYEAKGLRPETAHTVARELTDRDALAAHIDAEPGLSLVHVSDAAPIMCMTSSATHQTPASSASTSLRPIRLRR